MLDYRAMALELLETTEMSIITQYMDDDIREAVHADMAPCSSRDFLAEYIKRHYEAYGEIFTIG